MLDYSTDLICYQLEKLGEKYLRINRDCFSEYEIVYSLYSQVMVIRINKKEYCISNGSLKGIYFRAPVFIRSHKNYNLEEQLHRSQWNAFIRNLIIFDNANWINNPVYVYQAENKLFQLKVANEIGLTIPKTFLGNALPDNIVENSNYVIKSIDTALFYNGNEEYFTYSTKLNSQELKNIYLKSAPIIFQEYLDNKIDLRVTVIDRSIYAVSITDNGNGIDGDWRKTPKEELLYTIVDLPEYVQNKIFKLMDKLNLVFGGIDLAKVNNEYYFIEVNPTGEWGWLTSTGLPIDKEIVSALRK